MAATKQQNPHPEAWSIRLARGDDQPAVWELFERSQALREGGGRPDLGADLQDLANWYLSGAESSRFWVADEPGFGVTGMVGVKDMGDHVAAVRRLHVHPERRQRGVGTSLVSNALQFCRDSAFVKIMLEAEQDQRAAIALFTRFGFRLSRQRSKAGVERFEFYVDLYQRPESDS